MRKRILLTEICREGKISKGNMFYHIVSDVEIKIDKENYPDSIFFFKDDEVLFSQNSKNDVFWCSHDLYWLFFEREFGMKHNEIQSFTKSMVEQHFKMRVSTSLIADAFASSWVEQHFKMRVSTSSYLTKLSTIGWNNISK